MHSKYFYKEKIDYLAICVEAVFKAVDINTECAAYLIALIREGNKLSPVPFEIHNIVNETSIQGIFFFIERGVDFEYNEEEEKQVLLSIFGEVNTVNPPKDKYRRIVELYSSLNVDVKRCLELLQETFLFIYDGSDIGGENSEYNIREMVKLLEKHGISPPVRCN